MTRVKDGKVTKLVRINMQALAGLDRRLAKLHSSIAKTLRDRAKVFEAANEISEDRVVEVDEDEDGEPSVGNAPPVEEDD